MVNTIISVLLFIATPWINQDSNTDIKDELNRMKSQINNMQEVLEEHSELLIKIERWRKDQIKYHNEVDSLFIEYNNNLSRVKDKFNMLEQSHSNNIELLQDDINNIILDIGNHQENINSLNMQIDNLADTIYSANHRLNNRIDNTEDYASSGINQLNDMFSRGQIYGMVVLLLLVAIFIAGFIILRYKLKSSADNFTERISETRTFIENEGVKLDNKLLELLEKQINVMKEHFHADNKDDAHTLALKIADEITRIENNLMKMDSSVKGYKQLKAATGRMKDNMSANGYEIVDLLNKPFHDGMNVIAQFYTDEKYEPNEKIITHVIKPQVNYKGKMIQSAHVEVTEGE